MRVEDLTWQEYRDVIATSIVVLPIGAVDGHGPHLPLSTDTLVSQHLAQQLAGQFDVLILPAVPYGVRTDPLAAGGDFPGTTNLRASTLTCLILDILTATYGHGGRRFLILDSHKANLGAVREAADHFCAAAPDARVMGVAWWDVISEETRNGIAEHTGVGRHDDHHAALAETSIVMHIAPAAVRPNSITDSTVRRRARYLIRPLPPHLRTDTGVVYRASGASAEIGKRLMTEIEASLAEAVHLELGGRKDER